MCPRSGKRMTIRTSIMFGQLRRGIALLRCDKFETDVLLEFSFVIRTVWVQNVDCIFVKSQDRELESEPSHPLGWFSQAPCRSTLAAGQSCPYFISTVARFLLQNSHTSMIIKMMARTAMDDENRAGREGRSDHMSEGFPRDYQDGHDFFSLTILGTV